MNIKIAPEYSEQYLQVDRPRPLSDTYIEQEIQNILHGNWSDDISDQVYTDFKSKCKHWIFDTKLNSLSGIDSFAREDIIIGCTQYIDTLYMKGPVQSVRGDYRYHQRLGHGYIKDVGSLIPDIPLVIAMPFPSTGAVHVDMQEILQEAEKKNIPIHIDGAWITCCRNVTFNFDHPNIQSVGISLSKGLGLGWNRVGLRWTRDTKSDAITIMNDFNMNCRVLAKIGLHFVEKFPSDYLWNTYGHLYEKVCLDFNLEKTNSIYLALKNKEPVGVAPLIRHLSEYVAK
jgi:hypothetical protein